MNSSGYDALPTVAYMQIPAEKHMLDTVTDSDMELLSFRIRTDIDIDVAGGLIVSISFIYSDNGITEQRLILCSCRTE